MSEDSAAAPERSGGGLAYILGATAVAGAIGYVIQAAVPAFVDQAQYVVFSVFWSIVYLVVSGLSGIQQEATRASRSSAQGGGWRVLARFAVVYAAIAAVIVAATAVLWAPGVFGADTVPLVAALAVAAVGYAFVAAISGALYGVKDWRGVAGMTVADAGVRLLTVGAAVLLGAGLVAIGWAVAVPFTLAALIIWLIAGRGIRSRLALDADLPTLLRHSLHTVGAAIATGVMISGLPFLLGVTSARDDAALLASLILVITLTRAPLVIPLLALQSYLVVTFRDAAEHVRRRVLVWGTGLLGATVVLSALAVVVGPWVVSLLYGDRYELPAPAYAAIVASAGLTGLLCITGPAALAGGRHRLYLAGWIAASAVTVASLFLPVPELPRVLTALLAGPVVGVAVHATGLLQRRASVSA
ncbi:hypothetical protein ABC304_16920 [Microbacterium sp. 1P10UB]|uniref:hypothetical protein n=1 Tax=unclassified Microbacterium TaxID=2609290 RepID=UPI0039A191B8